MKHNNIQIIGIPEGEEKGQGIKILFEKIMTENFPNMERGKTTQVQKAQKVPTKINPNRFSKLPMFLLYSTLIHTIIKMPSFKHKERILKSTKEKQEVTYKEAPTRLAADFSTEMLQARRE
ncbi:hypothetical protein HJG60_012221 [Phyllostomus discolor]|uniref:L1 transposable element RRM domain-containing protein n=1 Tax=Phyllostomus discolor TaxID=89673 RepID=A0A833ZE09_9CHIR|nr:hypothetical protein HJG60_012221 [Phyllostomus discolor]